MKLSSSPARALFAWLLSFSTLFLIFAGSLVTSTGSGLSVPDWPLAFGEFFPRMEGGVFYEHGHRMIATVIGFMTVVLAVWLARTEERRWVRRLGYVAVLMVIAQGVLGGITVILFLPPAVSILHAVLAQTFLLLTILIAWSHSRMKITRLNGLATALTMLIFAQLILGAVMRHTRSGLAIPDFPTMGWVWVPEFNQIMLARINHFRSQLALDPVNMTQVLIHLSHRLGAVIVTIAALALTIRVRSKELLVFDAVLVAQVLLGAWTVWSVRDPYVASVHVLAGALLLGMSFFLSLKLSSR